MFYNLFQEIRISYRHIVSFNFLIYIDILWRSTFIHLKNKPMPNYKLLKRLSCIMHIVTWNMITESNDEPIYITVRNLKIERQKGEGFN